MGVERDYKNETGKPWMNQISSTPFVIQNATCFHIATHELSMSYVVDGMLFVDIDVLKHVDIYVEL